MWERARCRHPSRWLDSWAVCAQHWGAWGSRARNHGPFFSLRTVSDVGRGWLIGFTVIQGLGSGGSMSVTDIIFADMAQPKLYAFGDVDALAKALRRYVIQCQNAGFERHQALRHLPPTLH